MGSDYLDLRTSTDQNYYKISFVDENGNQSNFSEVKSTLSSEPLNSVRSQDVTSLWVFIMLITILNQNVLQG